MSLDSETNFICASVVSHIAELDAIVLLQGSRLLQSGLSSLGAGLCERGVRQSKRRAVLSSGSVSPEWRGCRAAKSTSASPVPHPASALTTVNSFNDCL